MKLYGFDPTFTSHDPSARCVAVIAFSRCFASMWREKQSGVS